MEKDKKGVEKKMNKKLTITIIFLFVLSSFSPILLGSNNNQNVDFPFNENPKDDFSLIHETQNEKIEISLLIHDFKQIAHEIDGNLHQSISIGEESQIEKKGFPDVPNICRSFIIPNDKKMKVNVIDYSYTTIENINIAPSKGHVIRPNSPKDTPFEFDEIYNENTWYPQNIVTMREPYILRDFRGQTVCFQPFQYNPVLKTLKVYTSIEVEIISDGPGEINVLHDEDKTRLPNSFEQIYEHHFTNFGDFRYTPVSEEGNLLIITYDNFYNDIEALANWKNMKGVPTEIVNVSDAGGTASNIKNYIVNYYNNNGLTFVLLVGDIDQVPTLTTSGYASDPSYGYISGSDSYPEVFVGRFSAQNTNQLDTMINRTLMYEKNPDTTLDWFHKGVGIGSNEGTGDDGEDDWEHIRNIRSDLLGFTYTIVDELYDGSHGGEDDSGNPSESDVTISLNDGRSIVNYCGHGSPSGWSTTSFSSSDVHNLENDYMLPFVICVACNNGQFDDYSECFCEAWLRATNDINGNPTGAIVATGSSKSMSWDPPMDAQDEMNDLFTDQYPDKVMHTIGGIHANGCMHMNDEYGSSGTSETDTWHIFGDPSLVLRTDTPEIMTVNHPPSITSGTTKITVNVVSVEHALCAISYNGNLLGFNYTDSNGDCVITLSSPITDIENVDFVVTAFNKDPYITQLNVLPPVRQPAEFEPMEGVLIRYPFGISYDVIAEMAEDSEVITIVASQSEKNTVETSYQNNGVNTDHTSYLIAPTDTYWTRDYGPWFIFNQTSNELEVIDFNYNRPRPDDNAIPSEFAINQSLNYSFMDLTHTGGNYMTDGQGSGVSTQLVWDENTDKTHDEINQTVNQHLGITTYYVRPDVNDEYIRHIDCWAKYLSPDTILIREVPSSHPQYDEIEEAVDYFEMQTTCYGTNYNVVRVYTPNDEPYTNSLILNDKVLVPQTGSSWDDEAITSYQTAMPGYEVLGFTAPAGHAWQSTDALHCRTKGIPDRFMIYIDHTPLRYQLPNDDGFEIEAQIVPYSGSNFISNSPTVVWRNSTGIWNNITMTHVEDDAYNAMIPNHPCGETIEYYINAQDYTGRSENHPYIGEADAHEFSVTLVPDIWVHPSSFSFSNSADVMLTDILTVGNDIFAGERLNFTINCTNNEGYGWLSTDITSGSLIPGEQMNITVMVDTSSLPIGDYNEFVIVNSNDLDEEEIYIPVNLSVILAHDLGTVSVNSPSGNVSHGYYTVNATIKNFGSQNQSNVIVNCTIMEGVVDTFLNEDFSGTFLPEGWSQEEPDEWKQTNDDEAGGTAPEAYLYYSNINGDYAAMQSKPVNTIGAPLLYLKFNHSIDHYTSTFNCRVYSRSDSSDSWTDITPWENPVSSDVTAEEQIIDITSDIGPGTEVKFEFQGNDWNLNDWNIDDVSIYSSSSRDDGDIVYTTENTFSIDALQQKDITFTPDWYADTNGFYAIEVTTKLTGDQQVSNNKAVGIVEVFQDVSAPVVSGVHASPDVQVSGECVNVSCVVTDETVVDSVFVAVSGPVGFSPVNVSMVSGGGDVFYYEDVYVVEGNYSFFVWAEDTSGNSVTTGSFSFCIVNDSYESVSLSLSVGWNLMTVPVEKEWYASDLASEVVGCTSVSKWNASLQTYDTFIVGGPPSFDFPIVEGHGYFVDVDESSMVTMVGLPIEDVNVSLDVGWNLIGWYHDFNTTASSLAGNISGCTSVSKWNATMQTYDTFIVGGPPSFDFTVSCGMGLFVEVNETSYWNGD